MNGFNISLFNSGQIGTFTGLELINNEMNLKLTIPLLTGKTETIAIHFLKKERDINICYEKLKEKYLSLVKLITNKRHNYKSIEDYNKALINYIEKED